MDCEKFESAMLDELYGELDELTSAAAKRHLAGCARCSSLIGGLRATRRVAAVPLVEPSADLEERILAATERAWMAAPPRPRMAQVISLAGSWAMRPQTAMAAVFLVMIGTSVLLLRGKSARAPVSAEVTVTEQGTPAPAASAPTLLVPPELARLKAPSLPAPGPEAKPAATFAQPADGTYPTPGAVWSKPSLPGAAAGAGAGQPGPMRAFAEPPLSARSLDEEQPDDRFNAALRSYRAGRFDEAAKAFDAIAPSDPNAPDLWAARSIRDGKGCRAAVARFDKTAQRYRQTPPGWDALLEGALCYRALDDLGTARTRLNGLLGVDSHKDRARAEIERIDELQEAQASGEASPPAKSAPRSRAAAPAAAPAVPLHPPATQPVQSPAGDLSH
jgi:tetratricopeptide (TPR) repeat protein